MSVIHAPQENRVQGRHLVIPIVLLLAMGAFFLRLWFLQVVKTDELKEEAKTAGRIIDTSLAPRGRIIDRNGVVLADVESQWVVTAQPQMLDKDPETLQKLADMLAIPLKTIERPLKQNRHRGGLPTPVYVGVDIQRATKIAEAGDNLPGVGVENLPLRKYRETASLAQVMGWVAIPTEGIEKELREQGIEPADYVGRSGVEKNYEQDLMGTPGQTVVAVDTLRRPIRTVSDDKAVPGKGLVLTVDLKIQKRALELLGNRKGAVVAIEPSTGEVICLASSPTFDLSIYDDGLNDEEFKYLYENKDLPMFIRPIAGAYPPGSTFKIVTAIAAEMAGKYDPRWTTSCPGYLTVGNRKMRCENHPASTYSFNMAFTKSCNSYFGRLATQVGPEGMHEACNALGLSHRLGIDMPGEQPGLIPDRAFIQKQHGRPWSLGDTTNVGIGQGDVLTTPLQMASIASLVANRGTMYRPHLVRAFLPPQGDQKVIRVEPKAEHKVDLRDAFWDQLQGAMRNVVVAGTARRSAIPGIAMAGKTGSAENSVSRRTHAWFVGYAPYENPKIAFAVIVENSGHGGDVAAPIAKELVKLYLSPEESPSAEATKPSNSSRSPAISVTETESPTEE
ncbi:MAG: penicillin-binding protein 2 [Armatimonadetes bacterium]|nr:penicillin-binding protein 2 [Armatimonadota bacterium]